MVARSTRHQLRKENLAYDKYHKATAFGTESASVDYDSLIQDHFSRIANTYSSVRNLDEEPILYINDCIDWFSDLRLADVGCGDGRYTKKFLETCKNKPQRLVCLDTNYQMLEQLRKKLEPYNTQYLEIKQSNAEAMPIEDSSLNCIITFNAIHHFDASRFLAESARVLENEGYLFVYTRLQEQNRQTIWGKHFPWFNEKESRLFDAEGFERMVDSVSQLDIRTIRYFEFPRSASLDELVVKARNHHYTTFELYSKEEFEESLEDFTSNLKNEYEDTNKIMWHDYNTMFVLQKRSA